MSAYGAIALNRLSEDPLKGTIWLVPGRDGSEGDNYMVMFHMLRPMVAENEALIDYMHKEFSEEVVRGRTYPQEVANEDLYPRDAFVGYFFGGDGVFLALTATRDLLAGLKIDVNRIPLIQGEEGQPFEADLSLEAVRAGRPWEQCVAGFYYVKPNYPGRSSHICNGGFVTPLAMRGRGYARILARSYLHYAPRLGYKGSVFNLVYVNNVASVRLWEKLNFTKAGRIPRAGRLRTEDGKGEEYVDAWIFYKSFDGSSN